MRTPTASAVQRAAAWLHMTYCVPGTSRNARWTGEHLSRDLSKAYALVEWMAADGWALHRDEIAEARS